MTIAQAIEQFDRQQPNVFTREEKLRWLSELDGQLWQEVLCHRGSVTQPAEYDAQTPADTYLAAPYPYDGIYGVYLAMQADRLNGEIARYNNHAALFHSQLQSFRDFWIRTNPPAAAVPWKTSTV